MLWGPASVLISWNSYGNLDKTHSFYENSVNRFGFPIGINFSRKSFTFFWQTSRQTNLCVKIVSWKFTINAAFWPKLYRTYLFNNITHRCGVWSRRVLDWWPLADTFLHPVAFLTSVMFPLFKLLFRVAEQRCIKLTRDSRLYRNVRYSNLFVLRRKYFVLSQTIYF